jgi:hypothetical protein
MNKIGIYNLKNILFLSFIVFCIQFTELKIDVIKVTEILLLLLTPFMYFKKINKWILLFLSLFILWFLISLLINPFREFYLLKNVSFLKTPYFITIGRFLELISCINLAALVHKYLKDKTYEESLLVIKYIFNLSFVFLGFNLLIFLLNKTNMIADSRLIYENFRLRGWYSEGGPYGLMLSFLFCLSFFYKSKYNNILRTIILLTIIFLARSKAGALLVIIWFIFLYYKKMYKKIRQLNIIIIVVGGVLTSILLLKLGETYINEIKNIELTIEQRPTDINLIMGRIAGIYIFPQMVADNPIFGIGLGNYPLIRNKPEYLGIIPRSPIGKTDAHGYGGIVQILVDGGLFILLLFFTIIYSFFKTLKGSIYRLDIYLYIFLCFFMLGVQIYFLYPWVLLGILIALSEKSRAQ